MERFRRLFLSPAGSGTGLPPAAPDPSAPRRSAAVAVIAGPSRDGAGALLFIRRAERRGDPWSGDMAFPGGRAESGDPDLAATALRETAEEIGWQLPRGALAGALAPLRSPLRRPELALTVHPYVFTVDAWPGGFASSAEVASVHRFEVTRLLAGEGRQTFTWRGQAPHAPVEPLELPCVDLDGQRIWGMTLRVLDDLLERLGPVPRAAP